MEEEQKENLEEFSQGLQENLTMKPFGETPASEEGEKPQEGEGEKEGEKGKTPPPGEGEKPQGEGEKPPEGTEGEKKPSEKEGEEGGELTETQRNEVTKQVLSETFGDQYGSVDELKEADIPGKLKELEDLRDANEKLKDQIEKPNLGFANETIGKFNQFVKDTGVDDYAFFNKLEKSSLDEMDSLDLLVLKQIADNPGFIGQENKVKKSLIKKYDVDPKAVEDESLTEEDLELNKLTLDSEANKAKKELGDLKGKIREPERPDTSQQQANIPTKEELEKSRQTWGAVVNNMMGAFKNLPVNPDGTKEPYMNYEVNNESLKDLKDFMVNYCVRNQLEPKKENIVEISDIFLGKYLRNNFNSILKVYGEKKEGEVRKKLEEEYENPSNLRGEGDGGEGAEESPVDKAFKEEMKG